MQGDVLAATNKSSPSPLRSANNTFDISTQKHVTPQHAKAKTNSPAGSRVLPISASTNSSTPKTSSHIPFYSQLLNLSVMAAKHRLKVEYQDFAGNISFKPGFPVPNAVRMRILILTTWRSGSTFLGDIFNAYPGSFYSFEPLHQLLNRQHFQDGPKKDAVLGLLRSIMYCNMTVHHRPFFNYARKKDFLLSHNSRYWQACSVNRALCFDPDFFNQVITMFLVIKP